MTERADAAPAAEPAGSGGAGAAARIVTDPSPDAPARPADAPAERVPAEHARSVPGGGRARGWVRAGGLLGREWLLATGAAVLVAAVMTWPTLRDPATTIPHDIYDPLLMAWQLAWAGHAVLTQPWDLWQSNTFFPEPDSFAFSDSLLGFAPLGFFGSGPAAAVVRANLLYVLLPALAFLGAYALARRLGAWWPGAALAGMVFAYAPWRLAQAGHYHVLATGGIALALAALAKGHGYSFTRGYRPEEARPGWAAAGWALAAWQLTIGFGIGLPFAYALALLGTVALVGWLVAGRPPFPRRLLGVDLAGAGAFVVVALLMALPYLRVVDRHPYARRTEEELALYAPPLRGFLTAPWESWTWGDIATPLRDSVPFPPEMTMLPGFGVIVLAFVGLTVSIWTVRQRVLLAAAALASVAFAMGTTFYGGEYTYLLLYRYAPGWDAIRTSGRLVIWTTLLLALLAAGAVTAIGHRLAARLPAEPGKDGVGTGRGRARSARWPAVVTAMALVPALFAGVEGIDRSAHPTVPTVPAAFRAATAPTLVLPSDARDQMVMLWSTDGFGPVVNGGSGFFPASQQEFRRVAESFPDVTSVEFLQERGVRSVVVLRDHAVGTPYEPALSADTTGLPLRRTEYADGVVFTLDPR